MSLLRRGTAALLYATVAWGAAGLALAQGDSVAAAQSLQPISIPQRIVSLLPSATEAVCVLGACTWLVGVDEFSQDPPAVRHLPRLGRTWQPDVERILKLHPDLVLVGRGPAQQRLQAAGLRVLEVDASTMAEVHRSLLDIDAVLHQQRAEALWQGMQARLQGIAQDVARAQGAQPAPRVYLEVDAAMYAAAPQSFMGELLALLGAQNIAPAQAVSFPRVSPEYVVRADPDVIIQTYAARARDLASRPGWSQLRAVREGRVCQPSAAQSRALTRPGPRLDVAAAVLAQCLRQVAGPDAGMAAAFSVEPLNALP